MSCPAGRRDPNPNLKSNIVCLKTLFIIILYLIICLSIYVFIMMIFFFFEFTIQLSLLTIKGTLAV